MSEFSNELSPAQAERLAILMEECGEVIQAAGKILRHGYRSYNPTLPSEKQIPNRRTLEKELFDLLWIINEMDRAVDLDCPLGNPSVQLSARFRRKATSAAPYLHHQEDTHA